MTEYRVVWEIDIFDADSAHEAARMAREIQLRAGNQATVFEVQESGSPHDAETVDLALCAACEQAVEVDRIDNFDLPYCKACAEAEDL